MTSDRDFLDVKLVLGHGSEMAVDLDVTSAQIVDRQDGKLEISLAEGDMDDYCAELGIGENQ